MTPSRLCRHRSQAINHGGAGTTVLGGRRRRSGLGAAEAAAEVRLRGGDGGSVWPGAARGAVT